MRPSKQDLAIGGGSLVAGLVVGMLAAGGDTVVAPRGPDPREIVVHQVDASMLRMTTEQVPAGAIVALPADMPTGATVTNVLFVGPSWGAEGVERTSTGIVLRARNAADVEAPLVVEITYAMEGP